MRFFKAFAVLPTALACMVLGAQGRAQLTTQDLNSGLTPEDLVMSLLGDEVLISNVSFTGVNHAAGLFMGGGGILGFDEGVVLSSGNIASVPGPNDSDSTSTSNGQPGDPDLDQQVPGFGTTDAVCLEFDFECKTIQVISFQYVFSSEEYNEYVNSIFNDAFGFFVNGVNVALLPDGITTVAINNVNCGNPYIPGGGTNCDYFINNDLQDGGGAIDTEMDGLTVVLDVETSIAPGVNHIKLCVADAGDTVLDSNVFIKAGSFVCAPAEPNACDACDLGAVVTIDDDDEMVVYGTIQMAANAATADPSIHTIVVCEGYYPETVLVRAVDDVAFIACGDVTVNGFAIKLSSNITIEGFDVWANGGRHGVWLIGGIAGSFGNQGVSLLDCSIHDAALQGIRLDPGNSDVLVENCSIQHCTRGIATHAYLGTVGGSVMVRGSSVSNNAQGGVWFANDVAVVLQENEFMDNGWYGVMRPRLPGAGSPETILLLSNLFSGNHGLPVPGTSDADVQNYDQMLDGADMQPPYTP